MLKDIPSILAMSTLGITVLLPLQDTRAEEGVAIRDAERSAPQTLVAATSNASFAGCTRRRGGGRSAARHARRYHRIRDGHTGSGFPGQLVGGNFAWPYYIYCTRRPTDENC